jgi:hypothetical protein
MKLRKSLHNVNHLNPQPPRRRCVPGQRREGGWINLAETMNFCGSPRCLIGESELGVVERGRELVLIHRALQAERILFFCVRP